MGADGDLGTTMEALACADGWASTCARTQKLPHDRNRAILAAFITQLEAWYWVQAVEQPARAYFPEVQMSMYSFTRWSPEHCLAPTSPEGWVSCIAGRGAASLSMEAPELKGLGFPAVHTAGKVPYAAPGVGAALEQFFGVPRSSNTYSNASVEDTAFLSVKLQLGQMKSVMLGSLPGGRLPGRFQENTSAPVVAPWINGVETPPTAFWPEKLLHLGLAGAHHLSEQMQSPYNLSSRDATQRFRIACECSYYFNVWAEQQPGGCTTMASNRQLSAALQELDLLVGCASSDRQWVTDAHVRWTDGFILTGMDVGADRRAWRLTPQLPRAASNWSEAGLTVRTDQASGV